MDAKGGIAIESWLSRQTGTSMLYLKVQLPPGVGGSQGGGGYWEMWGVEGGG